jgi:hypothetical protein
MARLTAVDSADPPPYRRRVRGHLYQSSSRQRAGAPGSARSAATGPAAVLALQRSLGNRAVRRVLQRAPTGIQQAKPTTGYTNDALAYWRDAANQSKSVGEYAMVLAKRANATLAGIGVSPMKPVIDTDAYYDAAFDWTDWKIRMNIARWSKKLGAKATKLSDLTMEEAADAAGSVYHEARHAEQHFRMARMLAGESKSTKAEDKADEIQKALGFKDRSVAMAAAGSPLAMSAANADLLTEAHDWEAITHGFHLPYRNVVNGWLNETLALQGSIRAMEQKPMTVASIEPTITSTLEGWRKSTTRAKFLAAHLKSTNQRKPKTPGDAVVITHLKAIDAAMDALEKEWKKIKGKWDKDGLNTRLQNVIGFKTPLFALYQALHDAYEAQTHETDAFATGNAVSAQFKAAAAAKPPPAKVPAGSAP